MDILDARQSDTRNGACGDAQPDARANAHAHANTHAHANAHEPGGEPDGEHAELVAVQIFDEFADRVCHAWLKAVCHAALKQEGVQRQLSLVIADDDTVRRLNHEYRGIDKTTDVLSFAFDNAGAYYGDGDAPTDWTADAEFVLPPGESAGLGEVIISYPQTQRQARQAEHSTRRELAHLITHGILHLLGHDHMDDREERDMTERERRIMRRIDTD